MLLADRGFINAGLVRYVRQLGWHCRIRARRFRGKLPPKSSLIQGKFWLYHPRRGWVRINHLKLARGEAQLIHNVRIHKHDSLTDINLAIAWEDTSGEYWYIISTEPTPLQTFHEYGLRFTIAVRARRVPRREKRNKTEENFLDDQSNGFKLENSKLRSAPALSRLCLVLAMTTLFLTAQGIEVVKNGQRRLVDPHWFRGSSYLKIGWSWVKKSLHHGLELINIVSLVATR